MSVMRALAAISSVRRSFVGRRIDVDPGYKRVFGDKTYEYAAVIEFDNREGLLSYLSDEKHLAIGTLFWKNCSSAVVSEVEEIGASELND